MQNKIEKMGYIPKKLQQGFVLKQAFRDLDVNEEIHLKKELQKDFDTRQELQKDHVSRNELQGELVAEPECQEDLILEEVAPDRQLVQEMQKYLPHSYQIMSMVVLHLRYQHFPLMRAKVLTPRCAPYRYKMVVITNIATTDDLSTMSMFWIKDLMSDGVVCQLLRSLPVNWKGPIYIRQIPRDLHYNMDPIISELSDGSLVPIMALPLIIFIKCNSSPDVPSLPDGYYVGPLKEVHGQKVLTGWVGSFSEKMEVFARILDHLPAVGIFKEKKSRSKLQGMPGTTNGIDSAKLSNPLLESITGTTDQKTTTSKNLVVSGFSGLDVSTSASLPASVDGLVCDTNSERETLESEDELVSWCLLKHGADIGMTYTTKGHRNLGLAKVATLQLVHQALDEKVNVYILSTENNEVSIAMHTKLGFEKYSTDMILMYAPKEYNIDHIAKAVRC